MDLAPLPAGHLPDADRARALRRDVRARYAEVAASAEGRFPYPVGRASAERLGYDPAWLDALPREVLDRFVGVGNPFRVHRPRPGDRVLDLGCGTGTDTLVAARLVGPCGRATGLDLAPEMLAVARAGAAGAGRANASFHEGSIETLPFGSSSFDVAISNGVLNLVPDKPRAFREIARVLRAGGVLAAADLVVVASVPPEVLCSKDAWSS